MKSGGILVGLCALVLSGCFDMKQDFEFRTDGTAKATVRLAIDAALIGMADGDNGDDMEQLCGGAELRNLEKDGLRGSAEQTTEGGDVVCLLTLEGATDKLVAAMADGKLLPADEEEDLSGKMGISLARDGDRYVLLISVPPMSKEDDASNSGIQQMLLVAMAGRSLSWSVTAPKIVETTGVRSNDGTEATFSIPLAEAFANTTKTYEFRTVFSTAEPGFLDWLKSFF